MRVTGIATLPWWRTSLPHAPDSDTDMITYAGCLIIWASRLQTETALSVTEAEYIALPTALREVIALLELCKESHRRLIIHPLSCQHLRSIAKLLRTTPWPTN
jgi:hypothetical protein